MKYLLCSILLGLALAVHGQSDTCLVSSELGISFPPVADEAQRDFTQFHLDSLGIKKMRFAEDWSFREPVQGSFTWASMDARIAWAEANEYELLLTIQARGPAWACGLQNANSCVFIDTLYFKTYIDSLLSRYAGKIDKIQFGNEWQTKFWYIGNAQDFISANNVLYASVQRYSPSTEVVLGGFTTSSLRYLAACNGYINSFTEDDGTVIDSTLIADSCSAAFVVAGRERIDSVLSYAQYDILDLHLYDDYEIWPQLIANFTDTISKPILVSEFGGPNMNVEPYTEAYQADKTYQYIKTLDSLGIGEIYYFKLVEGTANSAHTTSGLIADTTLRIKPVYDVVKSFVECASSTSALKDSGPLTLYPNPAKNWFSIALPSEEIGDIEIHIYDLNAKLVRKEKRRVGDSLLVNIADFDPGHYLVVVNLGEQIVGPRKLLIE